jgi:predicted RNase H-like HicB family nuclease
MANKPQIYTNLPLDNPVHLVVEKDQQGGFTISSPQIPELVTGGDTLGEAINNLAGALATADAARGQHQPRKQTTTRHRD